MTFKLNDEQRKLVSDNHNLIYGCANRYNINTENYYDILAIGLCKAAYTFNETKGKFSTYAYKIMKNDYLKSLYLANMKKRSDGRIVNADFEMIDEYATNAVRKQCTELYDIESEHLLNYLYEELNETQKEVLFYRCAGYIYREIADKMDMTHQAVSSKVREIKKIIKEYKEWEKI